MAPPLCTANIQVRSLYTSSSATRWHDNDTVRSSTAPSWPHGWWPIRFINRSPCRQYRTDSPCVRQQRCRHASLTLLSRCKIEQPHIEVHSITAAVRAIIIVVVITIIVGSSGTLMTLEIGVWRNFALQAKSRLRHDADFHALLAAKHCCLQTLYFSYTHYILNQGLVNIWLHRYTRLVQNLKFSVHSTSMISTFKIWMHLYLKL